jgi:hypothetical protein
MAGDGTSNAHKKVMADKVKLYGEAIIQSTLWRGESGMDYNYFYMTSLAYGMPATSLLVKECEGIQKPVVNAILPKLDINRNAPRDVGFATSDCGGGSSWITLPMYRALDGCNTR